MRNRERRKNYLLAQALTYITVGLLLISYADVVKATGFIFSVGIILCLFSFVNVIVVTFIPKSIGRMESTDNYIKVVLLPLTFLALFDTVLATKDKGFFELRFLITFGWVVIAVFALYVDVFKGMKIRINTGSGAKGFFYKLFVFLGFISSGMGLLLIIVGVYDPDTGKVLANLNKWLYDPMVWFAIAILCVFPILIFRPNKEDNAMTSRAQNTRASLEGLMNQYLEALVAHEPARLPLSKKVKHTENTIAIPVGEGLWATASDLPTYRLYVCDPQEGQVGLFGLMKENGFPILISSRLRIEKGLITEIENIVVRGGERPIPTENLVRPRAVFLEALKPSERVSREEMIRVSDLYFEGLVQDNGDIIPLWDECDRIENGMQTTNNPNLFPRDPKRPPMPLDCRGQINAKSFAYITSIKPRRYTVIDEERGITFGTFMFHHTGTIKSVEVPGIGTVEMIPIARRPFTVVVNELFKIKNGKIREIEAIMTSLPYGAKSGWDD